MDIVNDRVEEGCRTSVLGLPIDCPIDNLSTGEAK